MFGYLVANEKLLTEEELLRYKSAYCGLCRAINRRHGLVSRAALSYDLTFLILLLSSLYDCESTSGKTGCLFHPFSRRDWFENEITSYAADINIVLAYYKALDNWNDDGSILSASFSSLISTSYKRICSEHPDKFSAVGDYMTELSAIEQKGSADPDAASDCFGGIMAEMLCLREDRWADTLRSARFALGKFLYIMDACIDLEDNYKKNSYNPFKDRFGAEDNRTFFYDLLTMFMGDCLKHIDYLPLVNDISIIRKILCFGAWSSFYRKYPMQGGAADV